MNIEACSGAWNHAKRATAYSAAQARRRREHTLAWLAGIVLIVAWDATLRLDERVSPPRMRLSHAVEVESELQASMSVE